MNLPTEGSFEGSLGLQVVEDVSGADLLGSRDLTEDGAEEAKAYFGSLGNRNAVLLGGARDDCDVTASLAVDGVVPAFDQMANQTIA